MPGRVTYLWFYPTDDDVGDKDNLVTCTEYCGVMHSYMTGRVIVMEPTEFNRWYDQEGAGQAQKGSVSKEKVFASSNENNELKGEDQTWARS